MNTEQKAKAYDNAIEKAKYWHKEGYGHGCQELLEDIFPGLKENDDEKMRKSVIKSLKGHLYPLDGDFDLLNKQIAWLKSLKNRVIPQTKQEWDEDDEKMRQETIDWFEKKCFPYALEHENPARECISWLKSLRPQKQWKPTEEQMKALEHFIRSIGESGYASPYDGNFKLIHSLYNDLKKL